MEQEMMDRGRIAMSDVKILRIQKTAGPGMFEKILVAHDGSDGMQKAFDAAVELAASRGVSRTTMMEIDEEKEAEDTYFGRIGAQSKRRAARHSVSLECSVVPEHEVKAIVDFVAGGFDLFVVGLTGHAAVYEHLWGRTSHNLARMAHCRVLVVK